MAGAIVFGGNAEVKVDRFGMTNMEKSIRFRRKSGDDVIVFTALKVLGDNGISFFATKSTKPTKILKKHFVLFRGFRG
jgi:hypothetical protein